MRHQCPHCGSICFCKYPGDECSHYEECGPQPEKENTMIEVHEPINPKAVDKRDPILVVKRLYNPDGWRAYESSTGSGERALAILRKHDLAVGAICDPEELMIVEMKDVVWVR